LANPKVKYVRRLQTERRFRHQENAFVVEGQRWFADLIRLALTPELVFCTESWRRAADNAYILQQLPVPIQLVSEPIMAAMSDTQSPPGLLAVVPMPTISIPDRPSLLLILDEITNPGNLGTILRSAAAAGVEVVLLGPGCVDPYNPKVVRGSMGAHLRLPIRQEGWSEMTRWVEGISLWLASAAGEVDYTAVDWRQPAALIIGNEARGVGEEAMRLATGRISIPMHTATESLNAAVAASVILFEASRQRRAQTGSRKPKFS